MAHLSENSSDVIKEHVYSASANEIDEVWLETFNASMWVNNSQGDWSIVYKTVCETVHRMIRNQFIILHAISKTVVRFIISLQDRKPVYKNR